MKMRTIVLILIALGLLVTGIAYATGSTSDILELLDPTPNHMTIPDNASYVMTPPPIPTMPRK